MWTRRRFPVGYFRSLKIYRRLTNPIRYVGFSIGQKMLTPNDTQSSSLITNDRPYAGWLYASLSFTSKKPSRMDCFEFQLGVLGPAAQGKETQNFVRDSRDLAKTRGWSHQLDNEPGLALIYECKWRILKSTNSHGLTTILPLTLALPLATYSSTKTRAQKPALVGINGGFRNFLYSTRRRQ